MNIPCIILIKLSFKILIFQPILIYIKLHHNGKYILFKWNVTNLKYKPHILYN